MVHSAQDYGRGTGIVGNPIGGVNSLDRVLFGFDPVKVNEKYREMNEWEGLLDDIVDHVRPPGKIRREPNSVWPRFCRSIISAAAFLARFGTVADFYEWSDAFDRDETVRLTLPETLKREIYGFGFAIACIFLMDIGYSNFAKPDVHVKKLLNGLNLSSDDTDYDVFKAAVRIATNTRSTPYKIDRMCWLIGSGNFYLDSGGIMIGSRRDDFITRATRELDKAT